MEIITNEEFHITTSLTEYYTMFFSVETDIDVIGPYVNDYTDLEDPNFIETLIEFNTGLYFNVNDIRWQIALRETMQCYFGNDKILLGCFKYAQFNRIEFKEFYFPNYNQDLLGVRIYQ